jgi:hypothetical protein
MFPIVCNIVVPGLGTLFMKRPLVGVVQLFLFFFSLVLAATVFLTFFGLVLWFVDLLWALYVGVTWRAKRLKARVHNVT